MLSFYTMEIRDAIASVRERISQSALRTGRSPDDIKLVAVTKTVHLEKIIEAIRAGATIIGENRVQEAGRKIEAFRVSQSADQHNRAKGIEWHLIGSLQKNKAKTALHLFDLIHSVDSFELAEVLSDRGRRSGKVQRILVQVKLSDEASKHGMAEKDVPSMLEKIWSLPNLSVEGLMTMPPFFDDPQKSRPYFARLRKIAEDAARRGMPFRELSMGMTNDFEVAIEEGATMVRIGSAIFGERKALAS